MGGRATPGRRPHAPSVGVAPSDGRPVWATMPSSPTGTDPGRKPDRDEPAPAMRPPHGAALCPSPEPKLSREVPLPAPALACVALDARPARSFVTGTAPCANDSPARAPCKMSSSIAAAAACAADRSACCCMIEDPIGRRALGAVPSDPRVEEGCEPPGCTEPGGGAPEALSVRSLPAKLVPALHAAGSVRTKLPGCSAAGRRIVCGGARGRGAASSIAAVTCQRAAFKCW